MFETNYNSTRLLRIYYIKLKSCFYFRIFLFDIVWNVLLTKQAGLNVLSMLPRCLMNFHSVEVWRKQTQLSSELRNDKISCELRNKIFDFYFTLDWLYAKWCATKGVFMVSTFTRWYDWLELILYWIKYEFLVGWVYSIIVCQYLLMKLINIVSYENANFMYVYDTFS